ncbi:MAG: hypothetical protein Q4C96_10395 [Planctomycetia bacterium]|nr:hypothetical protein [Planctomycetia bacterium]
MAGVSQNNHSWRVFFHRTSLFVGILSLGLVFSSEREVNRSEDERYNRTYAAKKNVLPEMGVIYEENKISSSPFSLVSSGRAWSEKTEDTGEMEIVPVGSAILDGMQSDEIRQNAEISAFYKNEGAEEGGYPESGEYAGDLAVRAGVESSREEITEELLSENGLSESSSFSFPEDEHVLSPVHSSGVQVAARTENMEVMGMIPGTVKAGNGNEFYSLSSGTGTSSAVVTEPGGMQETVLAEGNSVKGLRFYNFLDVFKFDVDPEWVTSRWENVASVGPLHTRGYRVPLVTGPDKSDLVGSLTYYFNAHLEVEKITFEGYTGDLQRLIISLRAFHMAKRVTSDPNLLLYESPETAGKKFRSYMRSYHRTTNIDDKYPNRRFRVTMELYPPHEY